MCVVKAYLDHKASITSSCGKALTQERTKTKKRKKETYNLVLEIYCSFCLLLLSIVVLYNFLFDIGVRHAHVKKVKKAAAGCSVVSNVQRRYMVLNNYKKVSMFTLCARKYEIQFF